MKCHLKVCSATVVMMIFLFASTAKANDGKIVFDKQCASCHTIGGGESGGPDLIGITGKRPEAWLVRVIVEPDKLTAEKDPVQEGLIKKFGFEMPNIGVNREDAKKIISYLQQSGADGHTAKSSVKGAPDVQTKKVTESAPAIKQAELLLTPELIASGRALFIGEKKFSKGGASCSSCHAFGAQGVASGNLAADLTSIYDKMGEQGMRGVLKALKFPIMKKIYADKPLTDEEVTALVAFAKDAATKKSAPDGGSFPLAGIVVFICAIIALSLYKRRIG